MPDVGFLESLGTKVMALPFGPVPSNHHIVELVDEIKPKIRELIDNSNKVSGQLAKVQCVSR